MTRRTWFWILPVLVVLFAFAAFDAGMRLLVGPSPHVYGTFRGVDLPPFRVAASGAPPRANLDAPADRVVVGGVAITAGDLLGYVRDDAEIGYVSEESRRSKNGWWQTNEIGARSRVPTPKAVSPGRKRVAIFGGSNAEGSRLPQEETWSARLQELRPDLDVVNFGVDEYAMGQSLLLDRRMRGRIDYDVSLYVFVPYQDPWKEVNVIRYLEERWSSSVPEPRFVLEGSGLRLIPPFYPRGATVYERDYPVPSPELRAHLRTFDRFYVPDLYEPSLASHFMLWKLIVARRERFTQKLTRRAIGTDVDGEGFEVSRRILQAASDEAAASGRRFVVAVLPVERDLAVQPKLEKARVRWNHIVTSIRERGLETIDLAPALSEVPAAERDAGYDGTHYGPKMSRAIAQAIADALGR